MNFKEGKCPKCNGILHIPEDRDKIICMYCGIELSTTDILENTDDAKENINKNLVLPEDYEEKLQLGLERLPRILTEIENPLVPFKKDKYEQFFKSTYNAHEETLDAVSQVIKASGNKEEVVQQIASSIADKAYEIISSIPKKGAKEQKMMDFNLCLAVYVIPVILEYNNKNLEVLADKILEEWKNRFPKTNVGKSDYESINSGFKKKLCYITTAVCETLGKDDDCYELTLLRDYRDNFLMSQLDGAEIISEYYDIAPTIVKRINKLENSKEVYKTVWETYLNLCVQLIEEDKNLECKDVYYKMVRDLQEEYSH